MLQNISHNNFIFFILLIRRREAALRAKDNSWCVGLISVCNLSSGCDAMCLPWKLSSEGEPHDMGIATPRVCRLFQIVHYGGELSKASDKDGLSSTLFGIANSKLI